MNSKEKVYHPGDLIFGKVKGYPPWPARIEYTDPIESKGIKRYPVFYFGTYESSVLTANMIFPFKEYRKKYGKPRNKKSFNRAMVEIKLPTPKLLLKKVSKREYDEVISDSEPLPKKVEKKDKEPKNHSAAVANINKPFVHRFQAELDSVNNFYLLAQKKPRRKFPSGTTKPSCQHSAATGSVKVPSSKSTM